MTVLRKMWFILPILIYDLFFTVSDDDNTGYTLNIDSIIRGYSTAIWTEGDNLNAVVALGTSLSGRIDTDTSDGNDTLKSQVGDLTILGAGGRATANSTNKNVTAFKEVGDSYEVGDFIGTTSFALRFTSVTTPSTNVFMQNKQIGQGTVNYGFTNNLSGLNPSALPQGGDFSADKLGHFVTVGLTNITSHQSQHLAVCFYLQSESFALLLVSIGQSMLDVVVE